MAQRILIKIIIPCLFLLAACANKTNQDTQILSIQTIDRNGFSETISSKDRLKNYANIDFSSPQPYQKVLRVFPRNGQGQSLSKITTYHPNGHLWQYLEVVEGRAHGVFREWHANGKLKIEAFVMEGLADVSEPAQASWLFNGPSKVWDEQEHLVAEFYYDKGVLQGETKYYHDNGTLAKSVPFEQNEIHGVVSVYTPSGSLFESIPYQKGLKEGPAQGKAADGSWQYSENYHQDLLQEASYSSTAWKSLPKVVDGEGYQVCFQDDRLDQIIEIHQGKPLGYIRSFDKDGAVISLYACKDGVKEGEEIIFYPSQRDNDPLIIPTQRKLSLFWHEEQIQGKVKTWYENGVLESEREMNQNKRHGLCLAYYQDGGLMLSEEYENDKLLKGMYFKRSEKNPVSRIEQGSGIATLHDADGRFKQKITYEHGWPTTAAE